jgi:hypothetical protein
VNNGEIITEMYDTGNGRPKKLLRTFLLVKRVLNNTPTNRIHLERLRVAQHIKKFPAWKLRTSLPCSQWSATIYYPQPMNLNHTFTPCFFRIHFNMIHLSIPSSPTWSVTCKFSD